MSRWLIDLGNTRIKIVVCDQNEFEQTGFEQTGFEPTGWQLQTPITHRDSDWPERLQQMIQTLPMPDSIWLASVAHPIMTNALLERLRNLLPTVRVQIAQSQAECLGVRIAYREPTKIGVDRFLGLLAAHSRKPCNQVIVGCGTALTIDALHLDGRHEGGLIVAAPILMRSALMAEAGRIHLQREGRVVELATNTDDAMMSGSILAAAALVERVIAEFRSRCGSAVNVLAHGGGWDIVAPHCREPIEMVADLPLRGLAVFAKTQSAVQV